MSYETAATYDVGDLVVVSAAFTTVATGLALDPTVVKLTVTPAASTAYTLVYNTDAALVRDSAGNYHANIDANEAGTWTYRWWATGTGQCADKQKFIVIS